MIVANAAPRSSGGSSSTRGAPASADNPAAAAPTAPHSTYGAADSVKAAELREAGVHVLSAVDLHDAFRRLRSAGATEMSSSAKSIPASRLAMRAMSCCFIGEI